MRASFRVLSVACLLGAAAAACTNDKTSGVAPAAPVVTAKNTPAALLPPDAGARTAYRCFRGPDVLLAVQVGDDGAMRAVFDQSGLIQLRGKQTDATHFTLREVRATDAEKAIVIAGEWSADGKAFTATLTDPNKEKPFALVGREGAFDKPEKDFTSDFKGSLGRAFVRMKIERKGAELRGVYRYGRSTEDITLAGSIVAADGSFVLTESVQGKVTGTFQGVFASVFGILATWSSPDGSQSYPVSMASGNGYPETIDLGGGLTLYPQENVFEGKDCTSDVLYPQVRGATDKAKEAALNALLRGDRDRGSPCDQSSEFTNEGAEGSSWIDVGYALSTTKKGRFVSIQQFETSQWKGAAHPNSSGSSRVVDTKTLTAFRMAEMLTKPGRVTLGDMVTKQLQGTGPKLSEQNYNSDYIAITADTDMSLTEDGLVVSFGQGQIAPYFMGAPQVGFPRAQVRALFERGEQMDALFTQ